jgi:DNA polymerase III epsilon subunit-like protein
VTALGYAVVDVETSGFVPPDAEIVEIAVVHVDSAGQVTGAWDSLLRPRGGVGASWVHGVTAGMVRDAPRFGEVAAELHGLLAGRVVVAHNLAFDGRFLVAQFGAAGLVSPEIHQGICTLRLAQTYLPGPPHKLVNCCEQLGIDLSNAHSALGDALATAELLGYFVRRGVVGRAAAVRGLESVPGPRAEVGTRFLSRSR